MDTQTVVVAAAVGAAASLLTSALTEAVKLQSSKKLWLAQEQWKLKRDTYRTLLHGLFELRNKARAVARSLKHDKEINEAMYRGFSARLRRIAKARSVAALWLDKQALAALDSPWERREHLDASDVGDMAAFGDAVEKAITSVTIAATRDLKMDVSLWNVD